MQASDIGSMATSRSALLQSRGWLLLALLPAIWGLFARPLLPIDETRYIGVAWEMWLRGDFLVPHLNGQPYSHKPPLLFWLINAGWALFGVNEWWPRLVGPLAGALAAGLCASLGRQLWPDRPEIARLAPWLLVGALGWVVYGHMLMFDTLLTASALLALIGLWRAGQDPARWRAWLLVSAGLGLGLLSKGPVALLHALLPALLAPLWSAGARARPLGWYLRLLLATAGGAAIILAWALPAAAAGGDAYAKAIFLTQTAGRVTNSFAHTRPWWVYLLFVPALWLPWSLLPRLWRGFRVGRGDPARAFLLCWLLGTVVALSAVSGKQPHYAIPELPALALLAASAVPAADWRRLATVATAACVGLLAVATVVFQFIGQNYNMRPPAELAVALRAKGLTLITLPGYKDQLTFAGRMTEPLPEIPKYRLGRWFDEHPDSVLVTMSDRPPPEIGLGRLARFPYRGKHIDFWSARNTQP